MTVEAGAYRLRGLNVKESGGAGAVPPILSPRKSERRMPFVMTQHQYADFRFRTSEKQVVRKSLDGHSSHSLRNRMAGLRVFSDSVNRSQEHREEALRKASHLPAPYSTVAHLPCRTVHGDGRQPGALSSSQCRSQFVQSHFQRRICIQFSIPFQSLFNPVICIH